MTQNLPFIYVDADPDIVFPEQGLVFDDNHMILALPHPMCLLPDPDHFHTAKGLIDNIAYLCKMGSNSTSETDTTISPFQRSYQAGTHIFNRRYFQNYTQLVYDLKTDFDAGNEIKDIVTSFEVSEKNNIEKVFFNFQEFEKPKNLKKKHNSREVQAIMNASRFVGMTQNLPEFKSGYAAQKYADRPHNNFKYTMADKLSWNASLLFRKAVTHHAIENNITTLTKRDKYSRQHHHLITTASVVEACGNYRCSALMNQFSDPLAVAHNLQYALWHRNGRPNLGRREMERFAVRLGQFAENYDKNHALNEKKVFPVVKSSLTNAVNSYNTGGIQPGGHLRAS